MQEVSVRYWPEEDGAIFGEFKVDIIGKEENFGYTTRKLVINYSQVFSIFFFFCIN